MVVVVVVIIAFNIPRLNVTNLCLMIMDGCRRLNIIMRVYLYFLVFSKLASECCLVIKLSNNTKMPSIETVSIFLMVIEDK
jgi:hypothetical protein